MAEDYDWNDDDNQEDVDDDEKVEREYRDYVNYGDITPLDKGPLDEREFDATD